MRAGQTVALVSDAGMPLVSDPGFVLVRACVAAGLPVEVLPGPSAAIAALVASALPAERWRFAGFLPRKRGELERLFAESDGTVVAFESPRRVPATLAVLAAAQPERQVAVCRELTKVHEEVVRGPRRRAGRALRGSAAEGRGRPGARAAGAGRRTTRRNPAGSSSCAAWWRRARSLARRRAWSPSSPAGAPMRSTRRSPGNERATECHGSHPAGDDSPRRPAGSPRAGLAWRAWSPACSYPPSSHPACWPAASAAVAAQGWTWPVEGEVVRAYRNGADPYARGQHRGIDIAAPDGAAVVAAAAGSVRFAGTAGSSGLTVSVRTADGRFDTSYLHLGSLAVARGQRVRAGQVFGSVGHQRAALQRRARICTSASAGPAAATPISTRSTSSRRRAASVSPARRRPAAVPVRAPVRTAPAPARSPPARRLGCRVTARRRRTAGAPARRPPGAPAPLPGRRSGPVAPRCAPSTAPLAGARGVAGACRQAERRGAGRA